ncbi:MAG: decarboxylating 6-phosphogluconate dehydrogenase [Candidatus Schekmanbacteria bacterium]|nr:decarboxylating 6-phosphogluconate dehydrogenase [Candidatus Schekmanbacteria bacterium]
MQIGMIGLGRMGMNMARRLLAGGHEVVVYNRTKDKVDQMINEGAIGSYSLAGLALKLKSPRVVWMMLPSGTVVDEHIETLVNHLSPADILIDGSNGFYQDDLRRKQTLSSSGIHYLDAGVSGGIRGLESGYCLMIGGEQADFAWIEPLLKTLAPENGYLYCGPIGAGHFVKMVHNGIEYALMEAYGEGFELLKASSYSPNLKLEQVARLWNQGSIIRSRLLELLESALTKDPQLSAITGFVEDSGEGRWTVQQAVELGVSLPVIAQSLFKRFESRQKDLFSNKVIAVLRNEFGGHFVVRSNTSG